ncbi:R3H domain-containing protein [Actinidia chinensis var. chinensis]|uniref:R3H domain-containing protein n=1 Tax=Actinidia chinensis var. chinensis TaxID=1590841 RepID=A0A2R6PKU5_ACTCC|nr:R3H domain-containing protein [Actinidia chinensis var. chinensis]
MEGSAEDLGAPPDSWEVADLEASVSRLMLSSSSSSSHPNPSSSSSSLSSSASHELADGSASSTVGAQKFGVVSEDAVNSVDQFLREALQNPRERLSVLRMEQDVEKFIRDPIQQQMEFQQLPTSYLRLAAHRVAQHYSLQSMVLLDNNLPDGSGSKIIVRKTSECRLPLIRLADIPVNLPTEDSGVVKLAIKQRPSKRSPTVSSANSHSVKANGSKSVEERKEEYDRARARIFSSSSFSGGTSTSISVRPESELRTEDNFQYNSLGISKMEEKYVPGGSDITSDRGLIDSSTSSIRLARSRTEEPIGRSKTNSRVAIFRDREVERKDPDYDRNYDRYMQRFDPGFGFNGGPYAVQPMYSPALNYNTEFPQLGSAHRPSMSAEHQPRPLSQHLPGTWAAPLPPAGIGYGHPDAMMTPFSHSHAGARSTSALYFHSAQYPCQRLGMPFIHPHEQVHQPFSQSHQQQPDASFGLARPR